jgi:hypothetical protein
MAQTVYAPWRGTTRQEWKKEHHENRLGKRYEAEIRSWNWDRIKATGEEVECWQNPGSVYRSTFLGTVFSIFPSGKYYMPWACSNVTEEEAENDSIFSEVLERVAGEMGGSVESGEGDPCDLFFTFDYRDRSEEEEEE